MIIFEQSRGGIHTQEILFQVVHRKINSLRKENNLVFPKLAYSFGIYKIESCKLQRQFHTDVSQLQGKYNNSSIGSSS